MKQSTWKFVISITIYLFDSSLESQITIFSLIKYSNMIPF